MEPKVVINEVSGDIALIEQMCQIQRAHYLGSEYMEELVELGLDLDRLAFGRWLAYTGYVNDGRNHNV